MKDKSIFVIGDSVSIHYGPYLKEMIKDKFNYDRKRGIKEALADLDKPIGANAGDSSMVLKYLEIEKLNGTIYDILLLNCCMHDIRVDRISGKKQIEEKEYELNLNQIITIAKEISNKVIWITTTPFLESIHNSRKGGFLRYAKDLKNYNTIAEKVIINQNIDMIDLYNFTNNLGQNLYCDHVHFVEEVRKLQGAFIAGYLNSL